VLRWLAGGTAALSLVALSGCGGASSDLKDAQQVRSDKVNSLASCDKVACTGEIKGAPYEIKLPTTKWNGTLIIYNHGYRVAQPAPPDFAAVDRSALPTGDYTDVIDSLLAQGYAIAGSAFKTNGWDTLDAVADDEALHQFFVDKVGEPTRVYVMGDSLGGLITEMVAEKHPEWVNGSAPFCGVLAGTNLNLDLALDVAYAIKTLVDPSLKLTGFASNEEANANWQHAYDAMVKAAPDTTNGTPALLLTSALVDAPSQTKTYDGSSVEARVKATVEALATALGYGTFGRYEIEQRVGGNPSGNESTDYAARISDTERQLIDTVSPGATDRLLSKLGAGERVTADPAARAKADQLGNPTGDIKMPTITLHTAADPLALVQNESVFLSRANAAKSRTGDLMQLYTVAPTTYAESTGAPYGAGHCNFTSDERLGVVSLLDDWVRNGVTPTPTSAEAAFSDDPGLSLAYTPAPWPADVTQ
jgi:pimeloyl-ACP methyl ester carboxylesterase